MKLKWEPILECRDDDGNDTCWSVKIPNKKYSVHSDIIWIVYSGENIYTVESKTYGILIICKSLVSAKRWVSMNLV